MTTRGRVRHSRTEPLARRDTSPAVTALSSTTDRADRCRAGVDDLEVATAAGRADDALRLGILLRRRLGLHRVRPFKAESFSRGRATTFASVPKSTAPSIDAATAVPTKQSSQ